MEQLTNLFNPLIVWNNLFGVDVPLTEKPGGWYAQAEPMRTVPEWDFK